MIPKWIDYPEVVDHIKNLFKKINHPFTDVQLEQAKLPSKATYLKNQLGTAPGMWFYEDETVFVSMPGVPYEMKGLMKNEVCQEFNNNLNYHISFIKQL